MKEALVDFCAAYIDDKIQAQKKLITKPNLHSKGKSSLETNTKRVGQWPTRNGKSRRTVSRAFKTETDCQ